MLEAVVDTNVLISGLLKGKTTRSIINALLEKKFILALSEDILNELIFTLRKPELLSVIPESDILSLLGVIREKGRLIKPHTIIDACRDAKDNKFLECAFDARVKYLISGDNDLLSLSPFAKIEILKPMEFLKLLTK